jgi:hypothetical protein
MIPSLSQVVNAQKIVPNELQQQYPQPYGMPTQDYMYMMHMMQFYMNMYGPQWQDQIIKIYEDDDDDDNENDKRDWKKWFNKHHNDNNDRDDNDKKKYCEGKGKWNGHKCVIDNDKDRTAHEDAVCDDRKKSKFCGNANDNNKDEDGNKDGPIGWDKDGNKLNTINGDYDEDPQNHEVREDVEEEPEEQQQEEDREEESEPEEEDDAEEESDDDGGDDGDDSGGDDDSSGDN